MNANVNVNMNKKIINPTPKVTNPKPKKTKQTNSNPVKQNYIKQMQQIKLVLQQLTTAYNSNQSHTKLQQLGQLNHYLAHLPTQMAVVIVDRSALRLLLNIFVRVSQHKEIVICCILRVIEVCLYQSIIISRIGVITQQKCQNKTILKNQQQQQNNLLTQIKDYVRLVDFWTDLNSSTQSRQSIECKAMKQSLRKLLAWCKIIQKYKYIVLEIQSCLHKFTTNQQKIMRQYPVL